MHIKQYCRTSNLKLSKTVVCLNLAKNQKMLFLGRLCVHNFFFLHDPCNSVARLGKLDKYLRIMPWNDEIKG